LDFPAVDWVIQLDAPEDADTYIHRVGRTARFEKTGKALLFLCPSEEKFADWLATKKVLINRVGQKNSKKQSIQNQLQGLLFKDPELKYLGQKAFVSYCRSVSVQKDREIFKLEELPLDEYATSIGLLGAPRIKGLKSVDAAKIKEIKNAPRGLKALEGASSDEEREGENKNKKEVRTKYDRMVERKNINVHYANLVQDDGAETDDEADFLTVKRSGYDSDIPDPAGMRSKTLKVPGKEIIINSKRKEKMLKSKKELVKLKPKGTKLVFDDGGEAHQLHELQGEDKFREAGPAEIQRRKFLDEEGKKVKEADIGDRKLAKERRKEKRRIQKLRAAEEVVMEERSDEDEFRVELASYGEVVGDQLGQDEDVEDERQSKRQRKWFEDDEEKEKTEKKAGKTRGQVIEAAEAPENLEDLEMLASGLIG
jgi:ATP-dependent RNA helicase DDX10/DBP4